MIYQLIMEDLEADGLVYDVQFTFFETDLNLRRNIGFMYGFFMHVAIELLTYTDYE